MYERIVTLIVGSLVFYLLRFKILKKPLSTMRSGIVAALIVLGGIHIHYAFLPYATFQGGVTYVSLGLIAFLMLQYGDRRTGASQENEKVEK